MSSYTVAYVYNEPIITVALGTQAAKAIDFGGKIKAEYYILYRMVMSLRSTIQVLVNDHKSSIFSKNDQKIVINNKVI